MAAFFFPEDVPAVVNPMEGFIAYSSGERKLYRRQHVGPLDFAAFAGGREGEAVVPRCQGKSQGNTGN